ncbi:MAG: hypothetical protein HN467_11365 [Opitutae bacterium]|jgi:hypothetical protein|nr:hypothetical protein [Opitutae bacterium]
MKVAAGVFLIVAAIFNVMGGCFWAGVGSCTGCVGEMGLMEHDRLQQEEHWSESNEPEEPDPYGEKAEGTTSVGDEPEANDSVLAEEGLNYEEFDEQDMPTREELEEFKTAGAGMALYGFAILILSGVMIGAAVCAFKAKKAKFVLITGILAIIAEILGVLLVHLLLPPEEATEYLSSMFLLIKLPGLLAGILSIIAARSFPHPLLSS